MFRVEGREPKERRWLSLGALTDMGLKPVSIAAPKSSHLTMGLIP
jgi:hypothetical protein